MSALQLIVTVAWVVILFGYYTGWWVAVPHSLCCTPLYKLNAADSHWIARVRERPTLIPQLVCSIFGQQDSVDGSHPSTSTDRWGIVTILALENTSLVTLRRRCALGYELVCTMPVVDTYSAAANNDAYQCSDERSLDVLVYFAVMLILGVFAMFALLAGVLFAMATIIILLTAPCIAYCIKENDEVV